MVFISLQIDLQRVQRREIESDADNIFDAVDSSVGGYFLSADANVYGSSKKPGNTSPSTYQVDAPNNIMDFTGYGGVQDGFGRNVAKIRVPSNTLVVAAHGSAGSPTLGSLDGKIEFTPQEMVQAINRRANKSGLDLNQIDRIVFVSCNGAVVQNGDYMQKVANGLKTNVYAATETAWAYPSGRIAVADKNDTDRTPRHNDPGRFILFKPGGNPKSNKLLQLALVEEAERNRSGYIGPRDMEFNPPKGIRERFGIPSNVNMEQGRCFNQPLSDCLPD
jgi:hypothetical protein